MSKDKKSAQQSANASPSNFSLIPPIRSAKVTPSVSPAVLNLVPPDRSAASSRFGSPSDGMFETYRGGRGRRKVLTEEEILKAAVGAQFEIMEEDLEVGWKTVEEKARKAIEEQGVKYIPLPPVPREKLTVSATRNFNQGQKAPVIGRDGKTYSSIPGIADSYARWKSEQESKESEKSPRIRVVKEVSASRNNPTASPTREPKSILPPKPPVTGRDGKPYLSRQNTPATEVKSSEGASPLSSGRVKPSNQRL